MTIARILVANRGEIARRVFRTARAMGCATVAVYSDGDRHAPFVAEADVAVPLDGTSAAETYLDGAKLLAAAAMSGADAVHPGYGFVSENAEFAQAVIDAGLTWIGPPPAAIARMGDKLAAKDAMAAAGVPTLASLRVDGDAPTEAELAAAGIAGAQAYPLMVKASAGGGGKGMRVVAEPAALADALAGARREAKAAFGDDTVFVERCLTGARHVEIQVLGDTAGNLVHLFERECSIQRRHQKVIEEAPSPAVTPALRERLGAAALAAVGTLGYWSAGTVEFLLAGEGDDAEFFFLEVNTRLQVEHPVTEAITGLDLVREQIRIAAGEPLGFTQDDLAFSGWAVEARLYAEDPRSGFLPDTGTLDVWVPAGAASGEPPARFDSGVEQGSVVGTEFDPMLAKVVTHAPTRREAALTLARALERTRIGGVATNRDFLVAALRSDDFLAGRTDTGFVERSGLAGVALGSDDETFLASAAGAVALVSAGRNRRDALTLAFMPSGYRNSDMPGEVLPLACGDRDVSVSYRRRRDGAWEMSVGDREPWAARVEALQLASRGLPGGTDGRSARAGHIDGGYTRVDVDAVLDVALDNADNDNSTDGGLRGTWHVSAVGDDWHVHGPSGGSATLVQRSRFPQPDAELTEGGLTAPMPGKILSVDVAEGDAVTPGRVLLVMEAMKMEHQIVAPADGVVAEVRVVVGDQVDNGELLVVITAGSAAG
ncbi:MAG TPA: hypothetical protein DEP66_01750 [Acidimicrobiaceae bacterium]|nr:hypothetical protein [Acidimicrobiaceae bacterium]HCB36963.1 hypothetical protein [Acidimicrobiaceae bacterium]